MDWRFEYCSARFLKFNTAVFNQTFNRFETEVFRKNQRFSGETLMTSGSESSGPVFNVVTNSLTHIQRVGLQQIHASFTM
jgi:hypothetical protein